MKTESKPKPKRRAVRPAQRKPAINGLRAKLFRNGSSQAVRLPKEFRFPGTEVLIRREGKAVVLEPVEKFDWDKWWNSWTAAGDDFMPNGREQWPDQVRDLNFD